MSEIEDLLTSWTYPPSQTEQEKCDNAIYMVKSAIDNAPRLSTKNIRVFAQGSYRNNTNVRLNSDVDICVCCYNSCFTHLPEGFEDKDFQLVDATYGYSEFKKSLQTALIDKFGAENISIGNKAYTIHNNSYRIDADVVPCFEHRRYHKDGSCLYGTELRTTDGKRVINWPEQHYENGVIKNNNTNKTYKKVVRIFKKLNYVLQEKQIAIAKEIPSYLIECLVWNTPNEIFMQNTYENIVRSTIIHLYKNTKDISLCSEWGEVNELKYLFRDGQPWTREKVNEFILYAFNIFFEGRL